MAKPLYVTINAKELSKLLVENSRLPLEEQKKSNQEFLQLITSCAGFDSVGAAAHRQNKNNNDISDEQRNGSTDAGSESTKESNKGKYTPENDPISAYMTGISKEEIDAKFGFLNKVLLPRDGYNGNHLTHDLWRVHVLVNSLQEEISEDAQDVPEEDMTKMLSFYMEPAFLDRLYIVKINGKLGLLYQEEYATREAYLKYAKTPAQINNAQTMNPERVLVNGLFNKISKENDHYKKLNIQAAVAHGDECPSAPFGNTTMLAFIEIDHLRNLSINQLKEALADKAYEKSYFLEQGTSPGW